MQEIAKIIFDFGILPNLAVGLSSFGLIVYLLYLLPDYKDYIARSKERIWPDLVAFVIPWISIVAIVCTVDSFILLIYKSLGVTSVHWF